MNYLAHIADRTLNVPLMILPEKLAVIAQVLEGRINIDASELLPATADAVDVPKPQGSRYVGEFAAVDPNNPRAGRKPYRTTSEGVAIVPVHGSLVNRGAFLDAMSGITSYEKLKFQIAAAAEDADVKSILLDIDSPGGEAVGAFEAADAVRTASKAKPVVALANGLCCSAAYALASGATKIITSRSSLSGSIGTVMLHLDRSKQLANAGIKPTLIAIGKRKTDGNPFFELSEEVKGELRSYIMRVNSLFVETVAAHRPNLTTDAILDMEAGVFIGPEAVEQGLLDEVGSFESIVGELNDQARRMRSVTAPRPARTYSQIEFDQACAMARSEGQNEALSDGGLAVAAAHFEAITNLPEAQGRQAFARKLASNAKITLEAAQQIIKTAPTEADALRAGGSALGLVINNLKATS